MQKLQWKTVCASAASVVLRMPQHWLLCLSECSHPWNTYAAAKPTRCVAVLWCAWHPIDTTATDQVQFCVLCEGETTEPSRCCAEATASVRVPTPHAAASSNLVFVWWQLFYGWMVGACTAAVLSVRWLVVSPQHSNTSLFIILWTPVRISFPHKQGTFDRSTCDACTRPFVLKTCFSLTNIQSFHRNTQNRRRRQDWRPDALIWKPHSIMFSTQNLTTSVATYRQAARWNRTIDTRCVLGLLQPFMFVFAEQNK